MAGSATLDNDVLVDSLVADVIDGLRADLHPQFGVRPYRVYTVRRTWSGQMPGDGTLTEVVTELTPQPRVQRWDALTRQLGPLGLRDDGEIVITEVSLTYTHDELAGADLQPTEEWFIRVGEAHGQGQPARHYALSRPPYVDREKDMGWVLWLKTVDLPGCQP